MYILHQVVGSLQLLGSLEEFVFPLADKLPDLTLHQSHMADSLHHVTRARLTLRADHRSPLGDTAQCLAQVAGTTDERHLKLCLVDVIDIVGR